LRTHTNERNVVVDVLVGEAGCVWQAAKGRDSREHGIGLLAPSMPSSGELAGMETNLCTSISRQRVIPETLKRTRYGILVVVTVVAVRPDGYHEKEGKEASGHHVGIHKDYHAYWFWRNEGKGELPEPHMLDDL